MSTLNIASSEILSLPDLGDCTHAMEREAERNTGHIPPFLFLQPSPHLKLYTPIPGLRCWRQCRWTTDMALPSGNDNLLNMFKSRPFCNLRRMPDFPEFPLCVIQQNGGSLPHIVFFSVVLRLGNPWSGYIEDQAIHTLVLLQQRSDCRKFSEKSTK